MSSARSQRRAGRGPDPRRRPAEARLAAERHSQMARPTPPARQASSGCGQASGRASADRDPVAAYKGFPSTTLILPPTLRFDGFRYSRAGNGYTRVEVLNTKSMIAVYPLVTTDSHTSTREMATVTFLARIACAAQISRSAPQSHASQTRSCRTRRTIPCAARGVRAVKANHPHPLRQSRTKLSSSPP